jgi:flagellar assembly factor FliW
MLIKQFRGFFPLQWRESVILETSRFGKVTYKKGDIILMVKGLLGFEDYKQFILVSPEDQDPFKWLQSIDDHSLAFLVIAPLLVKIDYKVEISSKDLTLLEAKNGKDLLTYLLVAIPNGQIEKITANLQAPIIINRSNLRALQLIISESGYFPQFPIFEALEKKLLNGL